MDQLQPGSRYHELAEKWRNGTISSSEMAELQSWFEENEEITIDIPFDFVANENEHAQRIMAGVKQKTGHTAKPAFILLKPWVRYAAAIILIFGAGAYLWSINSKRQQIVINEKPQTIVPGGNRATLTLADGSTIILDSASDGAIAKQGNAQVIKSADGQLLYSLRGTASQEVMMNTMSTPKGGKYELTLPDGSKVWLNAASSITYPAVFTGPERRVKITGELYFEISKNKQQPFIVDIDGKSLVEVLGTAFNINSYADENIIRTTLINGSVKVMNEGTGRVLQPGQQMAGDKLIRNVNTGQVMAWKDGYFNFDDVAIPQAMLQIARWYDIVVEYEGKMPDDVLVGKLPMNASIGEILKVLEKLGIHFTVKGKKIIIHD